MYELTAVVAHVAGDGGAGESKDSQEAEGHLVAHIRVCLHVILTLPCKAGICSF